MNTLTRRRFLAALTAGMASTLSGCGSEQESDNGQTATVGGASDMPVLDGAVLLDGEPVEDATVTVWPQTSSTDLAVTQDPYETVDWSNEQRYGQFHAHIREHTPPETEERYELGGFGILTVGDAPCRTDHNQEHFYWPWVEDPSTYDLHHADGMVGLPGGEYDGGGLQHHVGVNTQMDPDTDLGGCGNFTEPEMIQAIADNPEIDGVSSACFTTHPSSSQDMINWRGEVGDSLLGCDGWQGDSGHHWSQYHDVLDAGERDFWHFASDDYSYNRSDVLDGNRNYFILEDYTAEGVINAIHNGAFYSAHAPDDFDGTDSTLDQQVDPPEIDSIEVDEVEGTITVDSTDASSCEWLTEGGSTLDTGFTLEYDSHSEALDGSWAYARIENADGEARTQPWAFDQQQQVDPATTTTDEHGYFSVSADFAVESHVFARYQEGGTLYTAHTEPFTQGQLTDPLHLSEYTIPANSDVDFALESHTPNTQDVGNLLLTHTAPSVVEETGETFDVTLTVDNQTSEQQDFTCELTLPSTLATNEDTIKTATSVPTDSTEDVTWTVEVQDEGDGTILLESSASTTGHVRYRSHPITIGELPSAARLIRRRLIRDTIIG